MLPAGPARQCEVQAFLTMSARVNNAARGARNMWPFSVVQMEELMRKVQREKLVVQCIKLSGHGEGRAGQAGHGPPVDEHGGQW